jgi:CHASE3 domain sensor protein
MTSDGWVEHTDRVIRGAKDAPLDLRDMTVAIRSFWLSSDKRYLARFEDSDRDLAANFAEISSTRH